MEYVLMTTPLSTSMSFLVLLARFLVFVLILPVSSAVPTGNTTNAELLQSFQARNASFSSRLQAETPILGPSMLTGQWKETIAGHHHDRDCNTAARTRNSYLYVNKVFSQDRKTVTLNVEEKSVNNWNAVSSFMLEAGMSN